jgi:hypothetical protein
MLYEHLARVVGADLYFKPENLQRCKAFKFRSALDKLRTLQKNSTVCGVSAGKPLPKDKIIAQLKTVDEEEMTVQTFSKFITKNTSKSKGTASPICL